MSRYSASLVRCSLPLLLGMKRLQGSLLRIRGHLVGESCSLGQPHSSSAGNQVIHHLVFSLSGSSRTVLGKLSELLRSIADFFL